jgi:hypothetical protein
MYLSLFYSGQYTSQILYTGLRIIVVIDFRVGSRGKFQLLLPRNGI